MPLQVMAEPRMVIGPTEDEETPEVVETISGLSYDQLRRLRELRKWLEERQMIRERIRLRNPEQRRQGAEGAVFADRELLTPLGQRFAEPRLSSPGPATLKLPPLPRFDDDPPLTSRAEINATENAGDDPNLPDGARPPSANPGGRVTHIYPPAIPGKEDAPQIEYELRP